MSKLNFWLGTFVTGLLVFLFAILLAFTFADAATFSWTPGSGGDPATKFTVKCGPVAGGPYTTFTKDVVGTPPPISTSSTFITGPGRFFCIVTASNVAGESGPSNEVLFPAIPAAPSGLILGP